MRSYTIKQLLGEGRLWFCNHVTNKIPSHHFRLWFYRAIMKFDIEGDSYIHLGCRFTCKSNFVLKQGSVINQYCHIDNNGGIEIGRHVSISPQVKLLSADHNLYSERCEGRAAPIVISDYCFIGFGAMVLSPCTMEIGSALGANSLLKGSAEAYYLYLGSPAKKRNKRPSGLNYTMNYDRLFH